MDPKQKDPEPINDTSVPNIIKPNVPLADGAVGEAAAGSPAPPEVQNEAPSPDSLVEPPRPLQPQAPGSFAPPQAPGTMPQQPLPPPTHVDTSQLFQPDTKLPEVNSAQYGNVVVDNRPPRGIKRLLKNRKLVLLLAAQFAAILLVLGGVFGYYLPNKPENVYKAGLDRTGMALDEIVSSSTEKDKLDKLKKSELSGSLEVDGGGTNFKGSFSTKYDSHNSDNSLDVKYKDAASQEKDLGFKLLSSMPEGTDLPDLYFQVTGLSSLGADQFIPGLSSYEGKWISVSADYLRSALTPEEQEALKKNNTNDFSASDGAELARIVSSATKEYVFTSDTSKSILVQKRFVATEKIDGNITANHYEMGVNNNNAKEYCKALVNRIMSSDSYKRLPWVNPDTLEKDKAAEIKNCESSDGDVKPEYAFDMWIDKRTKLIHKFRFSDEKDKTAYTEVGQNFSGGDTLPLFAVFHSDKDKYDSRFDMDINTKQGGAKGTFSMDYTGDQKYSIKASFEFKPYDGNINVEKPAGAIPIQEIFKKFGFDPIAEAGAVEQGRNSQAQDADKKSDINAIYSQVEVYFAINGYYPSLSQLNDPTWRKANLSGFSDSALGSSGTMASSASSTQYGYSASGCNASGQQCTKFTLTALLNDGQKFTKTGSNN